MDLNDYEIMTETTTTRKMNNTAKNIGWKIPSQVTRVKSFLEKNKFGAGRI